MKVVRPLWLLGVWLLLWSDLSVANVASGLVVVGAIVLTFDGWRVGSVAVRPLAAVRFVAHFVVKLVQSSIAVIVAIVAPRGRVHTGIIAIPLRARSEAVITLIADAVNLTPGTLALEIRRDPPTLYLHALDVRDADRLRDDVRRNETLALRAFGDPRLLAADDRDPSGSDR